MARKRRGRSRRRFNLRKVRVAQSVTVGALVALDVVDGDLIPLSVNPYRLMSIDLAYSLADLGATSDDGQEFGVAHSDYTAAEIEECLEAQTSIDIGNKVEMERANRLVRSIGVFSGQPGTGAGRDFNDGRPMKTKLNWRMGIGDKLRLWIRNGSANNYTTGALVVAIGNAWVKDGL